MGGCEEGILYGSCCQGWGNGIHFRSNLVALSVGGGAEHDYSSSRVIFVSTTPRTVSLSMLHAALSLVLSILDNIQHRFMAISTLDASLPALEDLIALVHVVPLPKRVSRGSLAISDAIFYSYANSMIITLVREMPATCKA
jgi:hypothetical protein